jgi:hypothetical protein
MFRSKGGATSEKKQVTKASSSTRSSKGGVFRRSNNNNGDVSSSKFGIKRSTAPVPIEQTLTWTMTDESASPVNYHHAEQDQIPLLHRDEQEETESTFDDIVQPSATKQETIENTFVFTEEDLKQNELNHIAALTKLETEIDTLKRANNAMSTKHATEIANREDENVELLIQLRMKEEQLATVRAELYDTKEGLKVVSCKLLKTQHDQFEENNRNQWMSVFGSSFGTF